VAEENIPVNDLKVTAFDDNKKIEEH